GVEVAGLHIGRRRADDMVDGDFLHSPERAAVESGRPEHRLDRAEPVGATREDRAEAAPERPRPSGVEVLDGAYALYAQTDPDCRRLQKRQLALSVEEVHATGVEAQLDLVPWRHVQAWVDSSRDLVAAHLPIEELVGTEALHHVDLHLHRRRSVHDAVGDRLWPEPERALPWRQRLGQLDLEPGRPGRAVRDRGRDEVHRRRPDEAGD